MAQVTAERAAAFARPYPGFRVLAGAVVVIGLAAQIWFAVLVDWQAIIARARPVEMAEGLDAIVNLLILSFGDIWFVLTLEQRWKRRRVLAHLYEFRSLAHIVDMHQLTKDPMVILGHAATTAASPAPSMSGFELSRYLDFCTEMLALIARLAALYAERTQDRAVTHGVNEIEELTSNLGRKIWQKIMILSRFEDTSRPAATRTG